MRETASPGITRLQGLARALLEAGRRLGMSADEVIDVVKAVS